MPNVLHEEPQKPQVTPLRFPAEGEPREREREAAKIVVMEKGTGRMVELQMEVADVDEMIILNVKPATVCRVDEGDEIAREESAETPAPT